QGQQEVVGHRGPIRGAGDRRCAARAATGAGCPGNTGGARGGRWWCDNPTAPTTSKPGGGEVDGQPEAPAVQPDQANIEAAKAEAAKADAAKALADEKVAATKRVAELNEKCGPWAYV